ncbi:prolipoprotein diacylglyceryl transferase [Actinacidiphila glaucinigra]|uniref:prolipoprotein diacylglyceryl transferase n=1 Tax=Actinacidiphila glaucinigra TaxID=235986 RepID=UPI00368BBD75
MELELAFIPSPSRGVIHLGPIPLRGYAFCIIIGVFVAVWLGSRRWVARGGQKTTVADIAVWAVPFGLVGGRLYHVITSYELYFGEGKDWVNAFKIWEGGLGIWGAIALGALGAWIACRRRGIPLPAYADAVAPGIAFAQAIGRWGNWFNQELYGRATDLPWALKIDSAHRPADSLDAATYHPTFLYESLWCVGVALLVIWADRRFKLGHGRAFALYVAAYTVGRFWIEYLRVDDAHHVLGLRLNDWTSILVFAAAVAYMVVSAKLRPGREEVVEPAALAAAESSAKDTDPDAKDADATDATDAEGADAGDADEKAADGDGEKTVAGEAEPDADRDAEDGAAVPVEAEAKPAKNL